MLILILTIFIGLFFINFLILAKSPMIEILDRAFLLLTTIIKTLIHNEVKKKKLIYFGYTYCPDVCPFDMVKISQIFTTYPELEKKIKPLFLITVDPKSRYHKTIKKIFIESFHSSFLGLIRNKRNDRKGN